MNAVIFSLTAVPVYAIAARVLQPRHALLAAALAVVLPSCVLTSAIMTENAFYPLFVDLCSSHVARARAPVRSEAAVGRRRRSERRFSFGLKQSFFSRPT